jgi:hypothetical protein
MRQINVGCLDAASSAAMTFLAQAADATSPFYREQQAADAT